MLPKQDRKQRKNSVSGPPLYSSEVSTGDFERRAEVYKTSAGERWRTPFRRDFARLVHSPSFRRLQGKTQLFPGTESDYFRNRLTHSMEVAQVGKSIATTLNGNEDRYPQFRDQKIDLDLIEFACLAHDLGHPPFGHTGEDALDKCMKSYGGFEGNAQTLRILSSLEKKELAAAAGEITVSEFVPIAGKHDRRLGLNTTHRALAAVLKYDHEIAGERKNPQKPQKGYFFSESDLVVDIKKKVLGPALAKDLDKAKVPFRTIECSIMDIADDIAYSTYDLEDSLKGGIVTPMSLVTAIRDEHLMEKVRETISERLERYYGDRGGISNREIEAILGDVFASMFEVGAAERQWVEELEGDKKQRIRYMVLLDDTARKLAEDGYYRCKFMSGLVQNALEAVEIVPSPHHPALHQARLKKETFLQVEVLKNIIFETVIMSSRMKIIEYRGRRIVTDLFNALFDDSELLPSDHRVLYKSFKDQSAKKRVICDFIAGMTDRFAVQMYGRLTSTDPSGMMTTAG